MTRRKHFDIHFEGLINKFETEIYKTRPSLQYILLPLQLFAGIRVVCSEIARSQSNGSSGNFHHEETEKGLRQYELEVL